MRQYEWQWFTATIVAWGCNGGNSQAREGLQGRCSDPVAEPLPNLCEPMPNLWWACHASSGNGHTRRRTRKSKRSAQVHVPYEFLYGNSPANKRPPLVVGRGEQGDCQRLYRKMGGLRLSGRPNPKAPLSSTFVHLRKLNVCRWYILLVLCSTLH